MRLVDLYVGLRVVAFFCLFAFVLALRVRTGGYGLRWFGLVPKALVWGVLGLTVKLTFVVFAEGVPRFLEYMGMEGVAASLLKAMGVGQVFEALTVSRVVVNAPVSTTAGGAMASGLACTNTLGCGLWGNNTLSENLTYKHLLNTTRVAQLSPKVHIPTDEGFGGCRQLTV